MVPSWALTLGRPQGTAWIGKPLDVAIPLNLEAAEAGGSLCPAVEVVQGDAAMDPRRVSVSLEPGGHAGAPQLRVRTTRPVDEPIVTMTVHAGCAATSTRTYVLLADPPPVETAPPVVAAGPAFAPAAGDASAERARQQPAVRASRVRRTEGRGDDTQAAGPQRPRRTAAAASGTARSTPRPATPPKPRPARSAETTVAASGGGGRLQVDALEPLAPRPAAPAPAPVAPAAAATGTTPAAAAVNAPPAALAPPAAPAGDLAATPATTPAAAQASPPAAAAAPSSDAVRDAERTVMLEKALADLREQTARNEQTLLELRRELSAARESRYSNPLVYALAGLLALALLAIVLLWRMSRRAYESIWTEPQGGRAASRRGRARFAETGDGPDTLPSPDVGEEIEYPDFDPQRAEAHPQAPQQPEEAAAEGAAHAAQFAPENFHVTVPGQLPASRSVNTEELFDVQQQAEFFLSLGQHEQAIEALSEYVAAHPDTSALAYLELLRIFHSLGRTLDYERVRRQCQQALNVRVPAFDEFREQGRPLDHYDEVLRRIEEHWPGPESLPVIEELLFRRPGEEGSMPFDLAAYRELLMLYAMAQEAPADSGTPHATVYETLMKHHQRETLPMALATQPAPLDAEADAPHTERDTLLLDRSRDFSVTRPPHPLTATLDFDLDELQAPSIETLPLALRKQGGAPDTEVGPARPGPVDIDLFDPRVESAIEPGVTRRR